MEIQLDKQTEHGYEVLNSTVFNHLLKASIPMGATHEITDDPEKVCINSTLFPKKGIKYVFSKYEELVPKFIKTKAIGAYYVNFMRSYRLAAWAEFKKEAFIVSGAIIESNPKFNKKWTACWGYDINSAYPAALLQPVPDVNNDLGPGILEEDEVGYKVNYFKGDGELIEVYEGFAQYRFKLIPSPWTDYVNKQYKKIQNCKKSGNFTEATRLKMSLVMAIGVLRNHNPFLYTHIIQTCRKQIEKYVDEDTILVNTDCIYSARPRPDIPIGSNIGEFKALDENGSKIYIDGADYQWEVKGEKKNWSMRGVSAELQRTYDLETKTQALKPKYVLEGLTINEYDETTAKRIGVKCLE